MFNVYFITSNFRDLIKSFDNEISAVSFIQDLGALYIEEDKDHAGCYDAIDKRGRLLCIEYVAA
jgi:hypothetical protein